MAVAQEDLGFIGYVTLGATLRLRIQCRAAATAAPTAPDAAPTWAIYGSSDTSLLTGSLGAADVDTKTGFRAGDAAITAGNGFASGERYTVRFAYAISAASRAPIGFFEVV